MRLPRQETTVITFENTVRPARPAPVGSAARKLPIRLIEDREVAARLLLEARSWNKRAGYDRPTWRRNLSTARLLAGQAAGHDDQQLVILDHLAHILEAYSVWRA
jgi:hypothetical protein